ncbi:archaetidylserine decarboxylase [Granulosicoccaceae sp. 1_MG-2023]|nr:archaetidylserine decarboxylase [Granulosicoccaceae sp. 1_MG-2023]
MIDFLKAWSLYFLPHHAISRLVFKLTRLKTPLKDPLIRWFIKAFDVRMEDAAESDIRRFEHFNAFFTRALKPGARPVCMEAQTVVSPVDGTVSQAGDIQDGRIFQAKGHDYSLLELLGGDSERAAAFMQGSFATIYLSPRDYHRIHMPLAATLQAEVHVPGRLFSVAPHTVNHVPRLFARNERVVAFYDSEAGPLAMAFVGAINVAAIETVASGLITPPAGKAVSCREFGDDAPVFERGAETARFNMGSTVILISAEKLRWREGFVSGATVRMGELIARYGD